MHKRKVYNKKKGRFYEFQDKGNIFSAISWYRDDHSIVFTKLG